LQLSRTTSIAVWMTAACLVTPSSGKWEGTWTPPPPVVRAHWCPVFQWPDTKNGEFDLRATLPGPLIDEAWRRYGYWSVEIDSVQGVTEDARVRPEPERKDRKAAELAIADGSGLKEFRLGRGIRETELHGDSITLSPAYREVIAAQRGAVSLVADSLLSSVRGGGPLPSPAMLLKAALSYVQNVAYERVPDSIAGRYVCCWLPPIETALWKKGDCDSKVMLLAAIWMSWFPEVDSEPVIFDLSIGDSLHCVVGIPLGVTPQFIRERVYDGPVFEEGRLTPNRKRFKYLVCEATIPHVPGQLTTDWDSTWVRTYDQGERWPWSIGRNRPE
jgi:hypothetical protein